MWGWVMVVDALRTLEALDASHKLFRHPLLQQHRSLLVNTLFRALVGRAHVLHTDLLTSVLFRWVALDPQLFYQTVCALTYLSLLRAICLFVCLFLLFLCSRCPLIPLRSVCGFGLDNGSTGDPADAGADIAADRFGAQPTTLAVHHRHR